MNNQKTELKIEDIEKTLASVKFSDPFHGGEGIMRLTEEQFNSVFGEKEMKLTKNEEAIMNEAFMVGRVYATTDEKETPAEIHEMLINKCKLIKKEFK